MIEAREAHGAAVQGEDRHTRKRAVLSDAQAALKLVRQEKERLAGEARQVAEDATERRSKAEVRLNDLVTLAGDYLDWLDAIEQEIADQRRVVGAAVAEDAAARLRYEQVSKPYRRREVPLERTIESLSKRLQRAGRRA